MKNFCEVPQGPELEEVLGYGYLCEETEIEPIYNPCKYQV